MKSILVLTAILFSSYVHAAPVVGDLVRYKMTTANGPYAQVAEQQIEVTAVDASKGTYTTTNRVVFAGTIISQSTETSDLISATESENTLDHCALMPSDMASIEFITVPAGSFKVCHIKSQQGGVKVDQYMGKVLLGLVKSVTVDTSSNTTITFELIQVIKH